MLNKVWIRYSLGLILGAVIAMVAIMFAKDAQARSSRVQQQFRQLETQCNGRLGLYAIDTQTGKAVSYQSAQRFPMCSTAKLMIVSAWLKKSAQSPLLLKRTIAIADQDRDAYSPLTHNKSSMTIAELCRAAISYSDNTASNSLVNNLGGPQQITSFARHIRDSRFRLDRLEPNVNTAIPGDQRDTTTPKAMAISLQQLAIGHTLTEKARLQLNQWLIHNTTGLKRIRAAIPNDWLAGDKTGTGEYGTTNDVAVIWPVHHKPIIVSVYFTQPNQKATANEAVLAEATRIALHQLLGAYNNENAGLVSI